MKQAILAELISVAELRMVKAIPEGAMTIEECIEMLQGQFPGLGRDKATSFVHEAVRNGKLKTARFGSRKYYYKP